MTNLLIKIEEKKYLSSFLIGIFADFWLMLYDYSVNHDWIFLQAPLNLTIPFISYLTAKWFIDEKDNKIRFKIVLWTALGNTIGTTLMMLTVKFFS